MVRLSKIYLMGQIHVTAIMTLVAGMPYFVCACSPELDRKDLPQPTIQMAECHCCGSCGSMPGSDSSAARLQQSCCSSANSSQRSQPAGSSPQARGKGCTKVEALPKIPGILSSQTSKPNKVLSGSWALSPAILAPAMQIGPQGSAYRWTGHAPAPPGDLVTSLQRLLI